MPDAIVESLTVPAPSHPLDPLTPDEIRRASAAVRAAQDLGTGMMFETVTLSEPAKDAVRSFEPGASFPREAFVCAFDRTNGAVFEARVDLRTDRVVDWRPVPGVRPRILVDDITLVGEVARADPRFRAALARRGITDFENVQVDPWSAGNYGLPDEAGRFLPGIIWRPGLARGRSSPGWAKRLIDAPLGDLLVLTWSNRSSVALGGSKMDFS